jgi:hypothetical protein
LFVLRRYLRCHQDHCVDAFKVQLRVLSKEYRVRRGAQARMVRSPGDTRFLIGDSQQAVVCCSQADLRPAHCWVVITEQGVFVQPADDAPASLNDTPLRQRSPVAHGDVLQLGSLVLEMRIQSADTAIDASPAARTDVPLPPVPRDAVSEEISDWLMAEDERVRREASTTEGVDSERRFARLDRPTARQDKADDKDAVSKSGKRSGKPGKLPPPPATPLAASSELAAEDALKHLFTRRAEERDAGSGGTG